MPRGVARDHDEKRAGLRAGAATYFARHGFDRASMSGAARECGVSKALIYHYYDSKEALLYDILDAHLSELVEVMEQDADAEHKLQIDALATLPPEMQAPLIALQRRLVTTMSDAIRAERPDLDADRVRALTMSIFGILNWVYMWHRPGKGLSREAYADLAADFVLAGLKGLPE